MRNTTLFFVVSILLTSCELLGLEKSPEELVSLSEAIAEYPVNSCVSTYRQLPSGSFEKLSTHIQSHDWNPPYDLVQETDYRYTDSTGNRHFFALAERSIGCTDTTEIITVCVNFWDHFVDRSRPIFYYTIDKSNTLTFTVPGSKGHEDEIARAVNNLLTTI